MIRLKSIRFPEAKMMHNRYDTTYIAEERGLELLLDLPNRTVSMIKGDVTYCAEITGATWMADETPIEATPRRGRPPLKPADGV